MDSFDDVVTEFGKGMKFCLLQLLFIVSLLLMTCSIEITKTDTTMVRFPAARADRGEGWTCEKFLYKFFLMYNEMNTAMFTMQIGGHFLNCAFFLVYCLSTKCAFTKVLQLTYPHWGAASAWRKLLGFSYCINHIRLGLSLENWGTAGAVILLHLTSTSLWNCYWTTLDIALRGGLRKDAAKLGWLLWNFYSLGAYFGMYFFSPLATPSYTWNDQCYTIHG